MDLRALSNLIYRRNLTLKHAQKERLAAELSAATKVNPGPGRILDAYPITADGTTKMILDHLLIVPQREKCKICCLCFVFTGMF